MDITLPKSERVTARISEDVKQILQQAAALSGATLNQFLVQAALEKAQRMIEQENIIRLTQQDSVWFCQLLDSPVPPITPKLKRAIQRYQQSLPS